jgi:hypothetical protein
MRMNGSIYTTIWKAVIDDVPPLKASVERALRPPSANPEGPTPE